ncbi:MAG: zinc ribbon domain-containing protein [Janthinobacterium lividum]
MSDNAVSPTQADEAMVVCQFCKRETPKEYNFCAACDNQINCLECGKKTYPGKDFCLSCSKPLVTRIATNQTNQAPNQYERRVKQEGENYEEFTRFELSDNSVEAIAPFVIGQTMPPGARTPRIVGAKQVGLPSGQSETLDTTYEEAGSNEPNAQTADGPVPIPDTPAQPKGENQLSKFFELDGDSLAAKENDFKGASWAAQQRNFILLYTKAYRELLGKPVPDKEAYKALAQKLRLLDPTNFTTYVNKQASAYMTTMTNGLVLNTAGEKEVEKVIQLMNDESKNGEAYWARPNTPPKPASYLTKEDKEKSQGWASEAPSVNLNKLDIRDISIARDYALLALWLITHGLKKADAVKWNEAMMFLTTSFKTIAVTGNSFGKAISAKENEKFFTKNGDGMYYLTPTGQKLVEEWIAGTKTVKSKKEASNS